MWLRRKVYDDVNDIDKNGPPEKPLSEEHRSQFIAEGNEVLTDVSQEDLQGDTII